MAAIKFKHKFIDEENIVVIKYYGDIYLEDLYNSAKAVYSDNDYNEEAGGISDFSESRLKIENNEIKEYIRFANSESKAILTRWAIIVTDPKSTVSSMLFQRIVGMHLVGVFSTWQGAASFHMIELKELDFEQLSNFNK